MILADLGFAGLTAMFSGWPYIDTEHTDAALVVVWHTALWLLVPWLALGAWALLARSRSALEGALVVGVVEMYAVSIGLFAIVTGPFESPGWILCLGGSLVGFLLFPPRVVFAGVVTFQVLVCGAALLMSEGVFRLDVLARVIGVHDDLSRPAVARLGVMSVTFSYVTLVLASHIIVRWRRREAVFEKLSKTDALTGLTNRRCFVELVEAEMARATRYGHPLALVMMDIDHFKQVNDTRGHLAGDDVLVGVAGALGDAARAQDVVCRYGGEEFAVLLPETDAVGAQELARRVASKLAATAIDAEGGSPIVVTMSMGIADLPDAATRTVDDFIRRADDALYDAKNAGRDRVVVAPRTAATSTGEERALTG